MSILKSFLSDRSGSVAVEHCTLIFVVTVGIYLGLSASRNTFGAEFNLLNTMHRFDRSVG
jgi:Flp pilus assembly pilin Flp